MTLYDELSAIVARLMRRVERNTKVDLEIRNKLAQANILLNAGSGLAVPIVEIFSFMAYKARRRIEARDEAFFKSDKFREKITNELSRRGMMDDIDPEGMSSAFAYLDHTSADAVFSAREIDAIYDDLRRLAIAYPDYVESL